MDGSCQGSLCGAVVLLELAVLGVGALGGGLAGALRTPPEEARRSAETVLARALDQLDVQRQLADGVRNAASQAGLAGVRIPTADSGSEAPEAARRGLEAHFELRLVELHMVGGWNNAPLQLQLTAHGRLVREPDGALLADERFGWRSEPRGYDAWAAEGGLPFLRALQRGLRELAEASVEEVFLIAYAPDTGLRNRTGYLLRPLQPEVRGCFLCREGRTLGSRAFARVDSRTPRFEWSPFEPLYARSPYFPGAPLDAVRYQLRVLRAVPSGEFVVGGDVVAEHRDITGTSYRLTEPLEPCARYLWSVRARFRVGPAVRVTEWSGPLFSERDAPELRRPRAIAGSLSYARWGYPFRTPAARPGAQCTDFAD